MTYRCVLAERWEFYARILCFRILKSPRSDDPQIKSPKLDALNSPKVEALTSPEHVSRTTLALVFQLPLQEHGSHMSLIMHWHSKHRRGKKPPALLLCPHATIYVSSYYFVCPHTTTYVSAYYFMCPHTTIYVSKYYYICVLILLYVSAYYYICYICAIRAKRLGSPMWHHPPITLRKATAK